jgi:hypothetical protein
MKSTCGLVPDMCSNGPGPIELPKGGSEGGPVTRAITVHTHEQCHGTVAAGSTSGSLPIKYPRVFHNCNRLLRAFSTASLKLILNSLVLASQ